MKGPMREFKFAGSLRVQDVDREIAFTEGSTVRKTVATIS